MKYNLKDNQIVFDRPLKKTKDGIKIYFYRHPDVKRNKAEYPVAYTDINKGQIKYDLPYHSIELFEVLVKQPKYKLFPFVWYKWEVVEKED